MYSQDIFVFGHNVWFHRRTAMSSSWCQVPAEGFFTALAKRPMAIRPDNPLKASRAPRGRRCGRWLADVSDMFHFRVKSSSLTIIHHQFTWMDFDSVASLTGLVSFLRVSHCFSLFLCTSTGGNWSATQGLEVMEIFRWWPAALRHHRKKMLPRCSLSFSMSCIQTSIPRYLSYGQIHACKRIHSSSWSAIFCHLLEKRSKLARTISP